MKSRKIHTIGAYVLFLLITVSVWYVVFAHEASGELTVTFLDVGQGDAVFIETPSGVQVLIDGGLDATVLTELAAMMPFWDRSIDIVIATHPDADHIAGLVPVAERYRVAQFVESGVYADTELTRALEEALGKTTTPVHQARRGDVFDLGDGVFATILFPDRDVSGLEANEASIMLRLTFGEHAFMLTGDSSSAMERYLVSLDGAQLRSTVLKAGHHGSRTSSDVSFVGHVAPEYVVFSRGCENQYGHPHEDVRELFVRFEVPIFDTCEHGAIQFISDGSTLRIVTDS